MSSTKISLKGPDAAVDTATSYFCSIAAKSPAESRNNVLIYPADTWPFIYKYVNNISTVPKISKFVVSLKPLQKVTE